MRPIATDAVWSVCLSVGQKFTTVSRKNGWTDRVMDSRWAEGTVFRWRRPGSRHGKQHLVDVLLVWPLSRLVGRQSTQHTLTLFAWRQQRCGISLLVLQRLVPMKRNRRVLQMNFTRTTQEHRYKGLSIYGFTVRKLTAVWSSVYRVPPVNSDITQICTKQPWDVSYASIVLCVETIRTYTSCCGPLGAANVVASYGSTDVVKDCQSCFAIDLPSCVLKRRQDKFIVRYFTANGFANFATICIT